MVLVTQMIVYLMSPKQGLIIFASGSSTIIDLYKEELYMDDFTKNFEGMFSKVDLTEFNKVCGLLDKEGINYQSKPRCGGMGLAIPDYETFSTAYDGNRTVSVICFDGSYGSQNGLLEIYAPGLNEGVEGYLNAEEALSYIKDTLNGISRNSCG